jgi:MGT family glycosyltransferase
MPGRFLLTSAPLPGHLDWGGYLETAAHLSRSGHAVVWVSEERIRPAVEAAGVTFIAVNTSGWQWPADPPPSEQDSSRLRFQRALDVALTEDAVARATRNLLEVARQFKPDVIIGEPFIWAAPIAAESLNVPYVAGGYPATPPDRHPFTEPEREAAEVGVARLRRLFDRFEVIGRNSPGGLSVWPLSPELHVVYWTRQWYADEAYVEPQTQFVGGLKSTAPVSAPGWLDRVPADAPLAFITLGSTFTDDPHFFVTAAHACVQAGLFPIIAMGRSERAPNLKQQLARHLPHCIAVSWVDYDYLFPRLSVVVHHGGMGTTHAAVVYGVPQVIIPHAADQGLQARRAQASGVGLTVMPQEATFDLVWHAIESVIRDPGFRIRAGHLSLEFAGAGGAPAAASRIAALARKIG